VCVCVNNRVNDELYSPKYTARTRRVIYVIKKKLSKPDGDLIIIVVVGGRRSSVMDGFLFFVTIAVRFNWWHFESATGGYIPYYWTRFGTFPKCPKALWSPRKYRNSALVRTTTTITNTPTDCSWRVSFDPTGRTPERINRPDKTETRARVRRRPIIAVTISFCSPGYTWTLVFSTLQHGFSLNSMYRKMSKVESPILLVIQDTQNNVSVYSTTPFT